MSDFVHLHLHSEYSLLDGASDLEKLVKRVKSLNMPAVAVTDHGNIFGAVHFAGYAKDNGIKPIFGCELYICQKDDHRVARTAPDGDQYNHLVVLAESDEGYRNLMKICSEASLHGFYYKPRISKAFLAEHSKGLIGLSACLKGEVAENLMRGQYEKAVAAAGSFREIFGEKNFFIEVQNQGLAEERRILPDQFRLAQQTGIPVVATNDSHYLCEDDAPAHDALLCVGTGKYLADTDRLKFEGNQFFVKSAEEMKRVFPDHPDALLRTREIADRCQVSISKLSDSFPEFEVPPGFTVATYFEHVARQGLEARWAELTAGGRVPKHPRSEYDQRLNYEIEVIQRMNYSGYFLIVWDFIRWAKDNGIPVGPGRGSAAGALVAYSMAITDIDPLTNELLFERFLNPERVSMPDIDVDFCMNRRAQVIDYVTRKYGRENVAQIITFGTMACKAAIKDVGRVMQVPFAEVDRIAKMVPAQLNITLEQALRDSPALQQAYEKEPIVRELLDTAKKLEGLTRNPGVHAAGVVISPKPLTELVPLHKTKNDEIVTAFDMKAIDKLGLLKMDFLGLTTLTILDDCLKLIAARTTPVDLKAIPLDDTTTYEKVFHSGLTSGIFQFESGGMRDVLRRYKPNTVEDLTALNALYRPGPIQGGMIDDFIERKWGRRKVEYALPDLEPILKETMGVMVYQEQVMQIAQKLAGFTLGNADVLRRAMGKKNVTEMAKQREIFVRGAVERGYPKSTVEHLFDLMAQFAEYGFNKSHSAAYALLAYQTAYLKTHYPVEFMAALLTSVSSSTDDVVKYINECREMGIPVEPPDVNVSDATFTPHGQAIRFGLAAVKNVGANAIDSVVNARKELGREFRSIFEFCEKVDLRLLNKRVLESLVKAGAMDSFGRRSQLMAVTDKAIERAQKSQRDAESGQHGLFGIFDDAPQQAGGGGDDLPNVPDWEPHQRLANEKEVLGFFITGHPLDKYRDKLADFMARTVEELCAAKQSSGKDEVVVTGGIISGVQMKKSKKGDMYASATLEDWTGSMALFVFSKDFNKLSNRLKTEIPVLVKGQVLTEEGANAKFSAQDIIPLDEAQPKLAKSLRITIPANAVTEQTIEELHSLFVERQGAAKVLFNVERAGDFVAVMEAEGYNVIPDSAFVSRVRQLCGSDSVKVID